MHTIHETLLVISIIDSFCAQLKLFCEAHPVRIFSSCLREHKFQLENFRTGTENTTLFHENCNVLENMRIYPNVLNCTIFSINRISLTENILKYTKSIIIQKCLKGAISILIKISWDQILSKYQHAPNYAII